VDGLKSLCKQLSELSANIADYYRLASESARRNEDDSKLRYRGELQTSLARMATTAAELDDAITQVAARWKVSAEEKVDSADVVPTFEDPTADEAGRSVATDDPAAGAKQTPEAGVDLVRPGAVWVGGPSVLRITERRGDRFKATFEFPGTLREISGTVRGDTFSWLGRDVHVVRGGPGGDNVCVIHGDALDMTYSGGPTGRRGTSALRLQSRPR
jgi:hypothetical protein